MRRKISSARIIEAVSGYYNVSYETMRSRSRHFHITYPRMVCMYLLRKHTLRSLGQIGALLERDHSTVIQGFQSIDQTIRVNDQRRAEMEEIERQLRERPMVRPVKMEWASA